MYSEVERVRRRIKIKMGVYNITCALIILICLVVICIRPIDKVCDIRNETATVTDRNVKNSSKESKYLIYCEDIDGNTVVYEVTDSLLHGRFNSSDVYAQISVGKTYEFTVGGSRSGFLSWYPNIYEYKVIKE